MSTQHSSNSSSKSTAYANSQRAGARSNSSATSPTGEKRSSQQAIFISGATFASTSAHASTSKQELTTSAETIVPAKHDSESSDVSEE